MTVRSIIRKVDVSDCIKIVIYQEFDLMNFITLYGVSCWSHRFSVELLTYYMDSDLNIFSLLQSSMFLQLNNEAQKKFQNIKALAFLLQKDLKLSETKLKIWENILHPAALQDNQTHFINSAQGQAIHLLYDISRTNGSYQKQYEGLLSKFMICP